MNDHGDPADGDLVEAAPAFDVPNEVAEAVRTLIRWAGDDPKREGEKQSGRDGHPMRVRRAKGQKNGKPGEQKRNNHLPARQLKPPGE